MNLLLPRLTSYLIFVSCDDILFRYSCFIQEIATKADENSLESNPCIVVDMVKGLFEIGSKLELEEDSQEEVELNKYVNTYCILYSITLTSADNIFTYIFNIFV